MVLMVGFREFHTGLILGASLPLAIQRLHSIRREVEKNTRLKALFGDLRGQPWTDDKLEFANGVSITAMGKGQALRGSKDEIFRPDFVLADDIEDRESVRTEEGRNKIQSWFLGEVLPAMDPEGRVRVLANILDPECLAEKLKVPGSGFIVETYPWEYMDEAGERRATWPARFPLAKINAEKERMYALGRAREYEMEFMCRAVSDSGKAFVNDMKRYEPRARTWEPVYCMFDPARTTGRAAATTGFAAWSWLGPKLVVWEMWAKQLMPDQIIDEIFRINQTYGPVKIGFEQDGLNEWALQPIRARAAQMGTALPLVPVKAPAGKLDFIRGLQIYFQAREVWFTQDFGEAWQQFLNFPTGRIDAPNALAYALDRQLRAGLPLYEDWNVTNVAPELEIDRMQPAWLALNATGAVTTAVLAQVIAGNLRVFADWVREGEPGAVLAGLLKEANLEAGKLCRPTAGPLHFDTYNNVGLAAAARRLPVELRRGSQSDVGRGEIRGLLRRQSRGMPALLVSASARWTLCAFAGGYCRAVTKAGTLSEVAEEGNYRTLMEGLESFAGLLRTGAEEDEGERNWATSATGQRYISARPQR